MIKDTNEAIIAAKEKLGKDYDKYSFVGVESDGSVTASESCPADYKGFICKGEKYLEKKNELSTNS
jgi:hypothetical protein